MTEVCLYIGQPSDGAWQHLQETLLGTYLHNTLCLALGVSTGTLVIGVACAWLVTMCHFPGVVIFRWALLLPMAIPSYLMAYAMTDLFQFSGPVQTGLREAFGWSRSDYWFPEMRSLSGAIAILTLTLYPYVYLAARTAFLTQSLCVLEASRTLGAGPWKSFTRIALPLARPAIAAGLALVMMETLAEFGAVDYCAVDTFSTGIYRTWMTRGSLVASAQLSTCLLLGAALLFVLEAVARGRAHFFHTTGRYRQIVHWQLSIRNATVAFLVCLIPIFFGFLLPTGLFLHMTAFHGDARATELFTELATNSVIAALLAGFLACFLGLMLVYLHRIANTWATQWCVVLSCLGYAIPGGVIAIGILGFLWRIEDSLADFVEHTLHMSAPFLLSGTILPLILGYQTRFLAVPVNFLQAGFTRVQPTVDDAARILGASRSKQLFRVHTPLIKSSLWASLLFVFIDVIKELPATLILRPFDFDTLAVRIYHLASDERLPEASSSALAIIMVGLLPVFLVTRLLDKSRPGNSWGSHR
ncbi:MAG: iron ABC transporter permease [Pirellulaceae bacterium]|nr:iron ABC transporter permease [Pirellulaceae bacterium]